MLACPAVRRENNRCRRDTTAVADEAYWVRLSVVELIGER